jgi:Tol biopolymer transport system component
MAADGAGAPVRLGDTFMDGAPNSWSSDGKMLAFSQGIDGNAADIWAYALESGRPAEPLISSKYSEYQARFAPDSRHIAYVSDESGQPEVYVQPVPPTGRKWKLSSGGGGSPVWSPDGRRIYYWQGQTLMVVPVGPGVAFTPERARTLIENVPISDVQSYASSPTASAS